MYRTAEDIIVDAIYHSISEEEWKKFSRKINDVTIYKIMEKKNGKK